MGNGWSMFKNKRHQRPTSNFWDTYSFELSGQKVDCTPEDWCSVHDVQRCDRYFRDGWGCDNNLMNGCCKEQCKSECSLGAPAYVHNQVSTTDPPTPSPTDSCRDHTQSCSHWVS